MTEITLRQLAGIIHTKALELSARASVLADFATTSQQVEIALLMIDESERAVSFWLDQLRKAARK